MLMALASLFEMSQTYLTANGSPYILAVPGATLDRTCRVQWDFLGM